MAGMGRKPTLAFAPRIPLKLSQRLFVCASVKEGPFSSLRRESSRGPSHAHCRVQLRALSEHVFALLRRYAIVIDAHPRRNKNGLVLTREGMSRKGAAKALGDWDESLTKPLMAGMGRKLTRG